jgi:hypothetical protein
MKTKSKTHFKRDIESIRNEIYVYYITMNKMYNLRESKTNWFVFMYIFFSYYNNLKLAIIIVRNFFILIIPN